MSRKKKKVRTKRKNKNYPYRSAFEKRLHNEPMARMEYEPKWSKLDYVITGKSYLPDFVDPDNPTILYEAKGYFRTFDEAKKYIHIRNSHPNLTIRFIVGNPNSRAYPQSKTTMGDWLTKNGFEWCTEDSVPEEWK